MIIAYGVSTTYFVQVESHLEDECLMTVVVCPYGEAGCTYQVGCISV